MSSVGRITSSLLSAVSENAFGLANFNFDFSLIKFEAPPEFQAVGSALSTQRRADAEDGPLHKTVRRLGGLFEQITPSTPKLIKAYGLRASEIIQTAGINPQGSAEDGPFQAFVGADGTSIWAAATSGPASLGIHLLSCMLARQFDDVKVATSIWVEIIAERQKEIEAACEANHIVSPSSVMAARQEIRRDDLALLDASARSWLRSADQVKLSEQKKLMLIVKNINVSVSGGTSTYSKVMGAWRQAMTGLENLLSEMPQEVSDGAILLALSSWHLYPDMVVLSNTTVNVKYDDPILPAGGIVTVGLRATDSSDEAGIRWSLALSHLRYYGDPVQIHSDTDNSRIDMDQLCLVALGALLFSWHVAPHDTENAALWFRALWKSIGGEDPTQQKTMAHRLGWLKILVNASYSVLEPDNEHALMLVSFGRRRGKSFLSELASQCRPFFGLCNPFITNALAASCDSECGLRYLRGIADFSGLRSDETVIRYIAEDGCGWEFATAIPYSRASQKRTPDGSPKVEDVHIRWIQTSMLPRPRHQEGCSCKTHCDYNCPCKSSGFFCGESCHVSGVQCTSRRLETRYNTLAAMGEEVHYVGMSLLSCTDPEGDRPRLIWPNPPRHFYGSVESFKAASEITTEHAQKSPQSSKGSTGGPNQACFSLGIREGNSYVLFMRQTKDDFKTCQKLRRDLTNAQESRLPLDIALQKISDPDIQQSRVLDYLDYFTNHDQPKSISLTCYDSNGMTSWGSINANENYTLRAAALMVRQHQMPTPLMRSLQALRLGCLLYLQFPCATIPVKIVSVPLHMARWLPSNPGEHWPSRGFRQGEVCNQQRPRARDASTFVQESATESMSRSQAFACIAMFESGTLNIDPMELLPVMAICSGDSIFVAGEMLSDPAENHPRFYIRRIVGNIGRPGITMMVAPQNPRVRCASDDYRAVTHALYDNNTEDNFQGTSLHLSFTNFKMPMATGSFGYIDQDVFFIESIVSVHDRGDWVADLDVLAAMSDDVKRSSRCHCGHPTSTFKGAMTSIDSWDELLDPPENAGIVRAHDNWAARLAAYCVLRQRGLAPKAVVVRSNVTCWNCVEKQKAMFYID